MKIPEKIKTVEEKSDKFLASKDSLLHAFLTHKVSPLFR